jgi:hypothetical protein
VSHPLTKYGAFRGRRQKVCGNRQKDLRRAPPASESGRGAGRRHPFRPSNLKMFRCCRLVNRYRHDEPRRASALPASPADFYPMPLVHPLVAALRLVCALMTIKVRRPYRGHDVLSFCACRNPFPAPALVRSETEARSNGRTGKSMVALGIDDDCSRRTHREVDMAVHRGTFYHLLSCLPLLRGENPPGTTDDPENTSAA